jgi:hypothetical protein
MAARGAGAGDTDLVKWVDGFVAEKEAMAVREKKLIEDLNTARETWDRIQAEHTTGSVRARDKSPAPRSHRHDQARATSGAASPELPAARRPTGTSIGTRLEYSAYSGCASTRSRSSNRMATRM